MTDATLDRQGPGAAPEGRRRRLGGRRGRLSPPAPGVHRCLVLARGVDDITAVDLRLGSFVRLRSAAAPDGADGPQAGADGPQADAEDGAPDPYDVVDARWATDPQRDDLAQPEAVTVSGSPAVVGNLRGRRARRLLRGLVTPPSPRLLGFPGSAAPYWEFHGMRPSVALVEPSRGPVLLRRRADDSVWARFGWPGSDHWLPVEDPLASATMRSSQNQRLTGRSLDSALGFRPHYLVITLSRPRQGHCYKTVAAVLPRP